MSDHECELRKLLNFDKFKHLIRVDTKHCIQYIRRQRLSDMEVILTVHLPYESLREWGNVRRVSLVESCSYVQILNEFMYEKTGFKVKDKCQRVEKRLEKACSEVRMKFAGKNGSTYRKLCQKEVKLALVLNELVTVGEIEAKLEIEKNLNNNLQRENETLELRCEDLWRDLSEAQKAERFSSENLSRAEREVEELNVENLNLHSYIENLGQHLDFNNSGKKLNEVGDRQQRRKLKELKTNVEQALWFAKTFGLNLEDASFVDGNGSSHTLSYSNKEQKRYKDLSEEDQQKVKTILFILDKFCIGDAAYHELTMASSLPRSYLIKQCKEDLNQICHITRTPGVAQGAELDFNTELETVVQQQIQQNVIDLNDPSLKLRVKLSGDGAKMSRLTNFVVLSFSVLNNQSDVMSSKGNHTVAIVKGQESYELLQNSCSSVFRSVNKLVERKNFTVDGRDIPVEVYLGGDYKFLLLVMGMKSATSDYACIWCKVHKKDRFDMSKPKDFYWGNLVRTISEVKDHAKRNKFSCQHQPLVDIALENIVLDELHLMLRVTDKLTKNLVSDMIEWDRKDNINKRPMERTNNHLDELVKTVKSCGVSFNVWKKMDADGKDSGLHDFTSLMGSDKKHLLRALPSKLGGVIRPETSSAVVKLWKDFSELYELVGVDNPTSDKILDYFNKAASWINLFTSLRQNHLGYEKARVTPYMHGMVYHVPGFMERHQGIKKFTGQGVEKLNDDCRRIHLQRSNKWDAAKDVLLVGKRIEHLSDCERIARKYEKQNRSYWDSSIKESRSKRHRICMEVHEPERDPLDFDVNSLTCEEIKLKLQEMRIKTRLRCRKKLQELLTTAILNKENVQQE